MKNFFLALFLRLQTIKNDDGSDTFKKIAKWNNQLVLLMNEEGARVNLFELPAIFIAFDTSSITQLGNGVQLYDPLDFEVHILDWQIDAENGTFEQNLRIFDLKQKVYQCLQKFQPGFTDEEDPAGSCIRISEQEDNNHNGVYHFIQKYRTTFVDNSMAEPVGGVEWEPVPMPLELNLSTQAKIDLAKPYNPSIQYLLINESYVSYLGVIYVIKANTPNPAGAFDDTKWTKIEPNTYNFTPTP